VFGLAVTVIIVDTVVNGKVAALFSIRVDQVNNVDTTHQAMLCSAVLELDQFDML